ncbi:MAG: hypothetical protein KDD89_09615 [Anaerolineales bacterium]|nr:hypothetical protein [Anaerolineales bacterium]
MKQVPVILFGAGGVGRALLKMIMQTRNLVAERNQTQFDIVGVADSKNWLLEPVGMSDERLAEILAAKTKREPLPQGKAGEVAAAKRRQAIAEELARKSRPAPEAMVAQAYEAGVRGAILVDVTAVDGMEPALDKALELGYSVALANKKALAGPWETAKTYYNHPRVRHESTVGGGQPVIATMRYLMDIGDDVLAVEGQLSGTLGYLCQRMDEGVSFSMALAEAKMKGFTEPDPREDLSGQDVMRKVLILARMAGWPLEAQDIEVESLYHASLAHLPVPEFMQAAVAMDPTLQGRVNTAGASGEVLRYVAKVDQNGGTVGLTAVPMESPLANLKYISYRTRLYDDEPMLICGKGAGVEMTAGGGLGGMIGLARGGWWMGDCEL